MIIEVSGFKYLFVDEPDKENELKESAIGENLFMSLYELAEVCNIAPDDLERYYGIKKWNESEKSGLISFNLTENGDMYFPSIYSMREMSKVVLNTATVKHLGIRNIFIGEHEIVDGSHMVSFGVLYDGAEDVEILEGVSYDKGGRHVCTIPHREYGRILITVSKLGRGWVFKMV